MGEFDEEGTDAEEQGSRQATTAEPRTHPTWTRSDNIGLLAAALAKAQPNFGGAAKDKLAKIEGRGGSYSYKYADLASIREACVGALGAQGLSVLQPVVTEESGDAVLVTVATVLAHASGEWMSAEQRVEVPPRTYTDRDGHVKVERPDARVLGSWETYLKKYGLASMVGVATEDDDGEATETKGNGQPKTSPAPDSEAPSELQLLGDSILDALDGVDGKPDPAAFKAIGLRLRSAPKAVQDRCRPRYNAVKAVMEAAEKSA